MDPVVVILLIVGGLIILAALVALPLIMHNFYKMRSLLRNMRNRSQKTTRKDK